MTVNYMKRFNNIFKDSINKTKLWLMSQAPSGNSSFSQLKTTLILRTSWKIELNQFFSMITSKPEREKIKKYSMNSESESFMVDNLIIIQKILKLFLH